MRLSRRAINHRNKMKRKERIERLAESIYARLVTAGGHRIFSENGVDIRHAEYLASSARRLADALVTYSPENERK